ncbi:uncharacterized protein LOC134695306 [Mytilus trossulus]|uniref:uncharacterized protein LOC134695306 n=1 Tax=Mytilus trossulus TaxID=6551 RepID=UPI003007554F
MLKEIVDLKNWVDSGDVTCSDLNTKTAVCKAVSLLILEGPFRHEDLQDLLLILQDIGRAGVAFTEFIISEEFLQMVQEAVQYLKQECKTEKSDEMYVLMEQFFDAINILSESSAEAKSSLVQKFCQLYLDSLLENEAADFRHRLEILRSLNVLLEDAPCSVKEALLSSQFVKPSLKKLSTLLNEIGDYEFQVCISECLFRIIPKKVRDQTISTVFKNQARRKDFLAIRDNEFETDCRIFLNKLNASLKKSNRVFSVPCNKAWLGDKELHKPDDPNYETFWVDFNAGSERLTVFCGSYNSSEMSSEDMWETLTVWKDDVQSFNVKKIKEVKVVNILFSKMVSDIYPSQQDVSGRSVRLQFDADCHVENALESTFGSDRTIQKVSSASTPLVINKDESSQELQDEEIPCTPVSSVYRRKVSVPDVSMPILLSPTGSISSKISEPVSAIRINFTKTPSAYTSKSKEEKVFQTPTVPVNKPKQRVKTPVVTVTPPSKSKKKTSIVSTAEVDKRTNVELKDDKTLASNNRKASLPELPIQSSSVDVESIPDSCPVEDGKSVSLEASQDVDSRIEMSVQPVEEEDEEKYPPSSNEIIEVHTANDEETSLNSDEHINKQNTKRETQKELKQGNNLSGSKPEKTGRSRTSKTTNSKEEYCNLLSQEYDTINQVMNNEELHIDDTDDFQVLESFHEAQKRSTKNKTKNSVLQKEESRKILTNNDKEKMLKLEQCEKKFSNIETNISIGQNKKSKINGKCRAAENKMKLEMADNDYDAKKGKHKSTKNGVTKDNGYNLVSPKPVYINIDIDDAERNFDFNDDIQVQESFPEPKKKSTKNKGKCQKKQKNSNEHKLLKDKPEQRDESDCDFYSNSGKENIDVNVIEIVTSKTKGTKKGGKEPNASSKLNKKTRKVESKDGLSEAFEHATNSFVSVDLEDCLEKKNNKHYEEIIESKIGEKASSNNKSIKCLIGKEPELDKDLETSSSKLRHNKSSDDLTCVTSEGNSFPENSVTAEQLHSSWNEELPLSAPDIKKQAKNKKEETSNLPEMQEFDDDNVTHIEIHESTTAVKNNTVLNKFEEYDDYELVIEDDNKFPKQIEFVMPEKYKVVCNSNKKYKQIEKAESPDFEYSDQDDVVPCVVNKIEQEKLKLKSVNKTGKEPKGNKNRKKSSKDSHDSSDIGTKDTMKKEQNKQKKKGIQKEKLNRKKSIDPKIIVEDDESDNDLKANSSYKFTCKKLPKFTAFGDSGINVDDETLEVTIPDSLTVDLPSNNEIEAKSVGEKGKAKKRTKGKPSNDEEFDFNICEGREFNVENSDDDGKHKSKKRPSISKLYVAEKIPVDVEKDDIPVPSHVLIENTKELTKVRDTVNNRKVPISGKARTDRMSKIGKYSLRKRNKEKLKEAFKVSDTEDEISSTQSSNSDRVSEQLQLTPDNITSYTPSPDDITSYTPNNKDQSTTFENKDKTVSLFDQPKQYGPNKRKSDCAITQNRKFFHSNSLSQTKNIRHYTSTTVQKIDSSACFGFESPRDDHKTEKSQNSKRSLLLLMSYSQSDTLLPCEKGDAGSDPYDFEAECNRQKGFKSSKVQQKKESAKSKQLMSKLKLQDDIGKKTKKKSANRYEQEELTPLTLFNDESMIDKKTKKERHNKSIVYNEEGLSPDFPLFNDEIDTYQVEVTKTPKKRSKGHNNKQKPYKEKKDAKKYKLNNSVSFKDECDNKKQRKMQKEVEFYPGDIEETIDSDQLDPTNLQSVVFDEASLQKISKRLSNMTSDDRSKATQELDKEDSSDSQEVRIGNILNQQSKLKSNCTSMPKDIDIGEEPAVSLDLQSPVHIQLKDPRRRKKKEGRKKKVEVCSDEEIDNAVLTSGPTKETHSILENFSSICKKIIESNNDQEEEEEDNCFNSKEAEVLKKSNLATKIGKETPYVLTRKSQKTPTTPGNIRKLYRSLDISVIQTPKTPASVYSDMDQIPLDLSGIFSSQKSFLMDSGDEKEEELKINKEVNKKGHKKKKDKKNEIEKHEVTYSPSSAISKILSRSLASLDLDEKEASDTADENPTLSQEDSQEFHIEEINRNKKKILKSGGLISGPSTTIRPSKSSLKRKYSAIMTSDLESSQDDDDLDKAYIPRKLFREQKYMVEEQMYSSEMVSDRSSEILSDVDPTTEVSTLLKAFGIDVQRHIGEKRHQLDSLTKSVLKSTQKQMNTVWTMQQRKRSSILNKYQGNMMKELVALEKDVTVLKEAEDNALTLFKQQMKHLQQFRTEQEKRLSNLCEAQQDLEDEMKEVENQSTHQHVMVKSKLREDLSSLQKKLLLESQKEELYHMKRNLQTIFC